MRSLNIFLATCWLATGPLHAEVYELPPGSEDDVLALTENERRAMVFQQLTGSLGQSV